MKPILSVYIAVYLLGWIFFTGIHNNIDEPWVEKCYWVWSDISCGSVISWTCLYAMGNVWVKKAVRWPLIFSGLMVVWELIRIYFKLDPNNKWAIFGAMLFSLGIVVYLHIAKFDKTSK